VLGLQSLQTVDSGWVWFETVVDQGGIKGRRLTEAVLFLQRLPKWDGTAAVCKTGRGGRGGRTVEEGTEGKPGSIVVSLLTEPPFDGKRALTHVGWCLFWLLDGRI
jgi:hypothetical protein